MAMTGCTAFLCRMVETPDSKLVKASPEKLAEKYGLDKWPWGVAFCAMYLDAWRRRG